VSQDSLYEQAADAYGAALDRLPRAYEPDAEARRDVLQDIEQLRALKESTNRNASCEEYRFPREQLSGGLTLPPLLTNR
jgi:hypothetical protein